MTDSAFPFENVETVPEELIHCEIHGDSSPTYVCGHLAGNTFGLGFHRAETSEDDPFPDAWCDNCEIIRAEHNGWNVDSEALVKFSLLCAKCYMRSSIRNTRTAITMADLQTLRWKCTSCEQWHSGPCLDFGQDAPHYWDNAWNKGKWSLKRILRRTDSPAHTSLSADYCVIAGKDFFIRGNIQLPIIGTDQNFCWGVWGSLSQANFETVVRMEDDGERVGLPAMFSWLSSQLPEYPDTLGLKMHLRTRDVGLRPIFDLQPSDHPLSLEAHCGITPERVKQIMTNQLRDVQ